MTMHANDLINNNRRSPKQAVQKRLDTNIKNRKSTRLTTFDSVRNLPKCDDPTPVDHRRQQLEKWKAEKEQKKKEQASKKKKPFLTGVPKNPLNFVPPPPVPKPSTSGRVTRSQTRNTIKSPIKAKSKTQSFAPSDASFKPPAIKNLDKLPKWDGPQKSTKRVTNTITFDPVVPSASNIQTRSRPVLTRQNTTETKINTRPKQLETRSTTRGKITKKPSPKKLSKKPLQYSSSGTSGSDAERRKPIKRIQTPGPNVSLKETKELTPKMLTMSTSTDKSSEKSVKETSRRKSARKSITHVEESQSSSDKMTSDSEPTEKIPTVTKKTGKSLPKHFSPRPLTSDSSTDQLSSDIESVTKSPVVALRRSLPCTPKNKIPKSESTSEERLRSPKSDVPLTPQQMESAKISPCVTQLRGKDNARKETKWKIAEGLLDDDVSDMDSVDHFRQQLSSEIKRITEMCETWDKISEKTVLPEAIQEAVLSAVGQARLLMSQKLQQFASLVERCAQPEPGTALVTPADLRGFWDMVFMQVENVDMRFKKLEELRARDWVEEQPTVQLKKATNKPVAKKTARPVATSRIRDMIAAARKAKKDQPQPNLQVTAASDVEKTFEAGFFCVRSPVKSPVNLSSTPLNKHNLLKDVLSNEAKKASASKNSTSLAMLRASIIGKNMDVEDAAPLPETPKMTPLNLFATPGRSILKSANVQSAKKSGKQSIKTVLFDDSDSDSQYVSFARESDMNTVMNTTSTAPMIEKENSLSPQIERSVSKRKGRRSLQNISNIEDVTEKTPRRSARNKKVIEESTETEKTPTRLKRSTKKKAAAVLESSAVEDIKATPIRSSRRNKAIVNRMADDDIV